MLFLKTLGQLVHLLTLATLALAAGIAAVNVVLIGLQITDHSLAVQTSYGLAAVAAMSISHFLNGFINAYKAELSK